MKKALLLVNYELWYGAAKQKGQLPEIGKVIGELKNRYLLERIVFMADFTKPEIAKMAPTLERFTDFLINTNDAEKKENPYLFCTLEEIYYYVTTIKPDEKANHAIIVLTGDWRFTSILEFTHNNLEIETLVIAPKDSLSPMLKDAIPHMEINVTGHINDLGKALIRKELLSCLKYAENTNIPAAFKKTAQLVSKQTDSELVFVEMVLTNMIEAGEVVRYQTLTPDKKEVKLLRVDWDKVEEE